MKYEWEIETLKNLILNMENETTDIEFLIDGLTSVIDNLEEEYGE